MLFVFHLLDRPGVAELRASTRPLHKEYLARVADRIAFAGPLIGVAAPGDYVGSLLVIDFADEPAARAWLKNEPFTQAGVYGETNVHAFENLWAQRVGFPSI
jgi:uncharacterized protein YciI